MNGVVAVAEARDRGRGLAAAASLRSRCARRPRRRGARGLARGRGRAAGAARRRRATHPSGFEGEVSRTSRVRGSEPPRARRSRSRIARRRATSGTSTGTPWQSATIDAPFGQAGERMIASSPGSMAERIARCSAMSPDAVTTISGPGSSSTPCSRWYCAAIAAPERRQSRVLRVEGVAVPQRLRRRLDDVRGRREVRLAEVQAEHAVHRHRELAELADARVRHARERGRERRPVDGRAQRRLGHRSRSGSTWGTRTIVTAAGAGFAGEPSPGQRERDHPGS